MSKEIEVRKRRTVQQARAREKRILEGISEIGPFIQDHDWEVLGYESFTLWADEKFFPVLNALDAAVKREIQPSVHKALDEDGLSLRKIAARTGASKSTVANDLNNDKLKVEPTVQNWTDPDLGTTSDQDKETIVDAEIIEESLAGKNLFDLVQKQNRENPGHQPQDTAEDAAKWIPALMEAINADLDAVADWQEISDEYTNKLLREELDILRDKITRIEAKLT